MHECYSCLPFFRTKIRGLSGVEARYIIKKLMKEQTFRIKVLITTYLFPSSLKKDLAPKSTWRLKGCQGFVGPVPPPFFISIQLR
jgi:hypothetical protein